MISVFWLLVGCLAAAVFVGLARQRGDQELRVLALGLVIAGFIYAGFGFTSGSIKWVGIEWGGVLLYGLLAWAGVRYHPIWVAIGWLLHPAWDAGLHLTGEGAEFVPFWYAMLCLSFDLIVAGYIGYRFCLKKDAVPQYS